MSCLVASVPSGGSSVLLLAWRRALVRSLTAARMRHSLLATCMQKLCGNHLMVSHIFVLPVALFHTLKQRQCCIAGPTWKPLYACRSQDLRSSGCMYPRDFIPGGANGVLL